MSSFVKIVENSQKDLVYLVKLKEAGFKLSSWYYLQLKSKLTEPLFLSKMDSNIDLNDYGTILYSGWGTEPPEDIKQKIKEQFGG